MTLGESLSCWGESMQMFLTSSVDCVAHDIAKRIETKGKKLVFIYTAAEVEEGGLNADWCQADRQALVEVGFEVSDYTITGKTQKDLATDLSQFDFIYMSGGNSLYLLQQSQITGFAEVIRDLVLKLEKIYISTSAGSVVAGPDLYPTHRLDDPELAPNLNGFKGFGLINFAILPHWGSDHFKDKYLNRRLPHAYLADSIPLLAITDRQYVWVKDEKFEIIEV